MLEFETDIKSARSSRNGQMNMKNRIMGKKSRKKWRKQQVELCFFWIHLLNGFFPTSHACFPFLQRLGSSVVVQHHLCYLLFFPLVHFFPVNFVPIFVMCCASHVHTTFFLVRFFPLFLSLAVCFCRSYLVNQLWFLLRNCYAHVTVCCLFTERS